EVTHNLISDFLGWSGSYRLPRWKAEGYCDYIAAESSFDFDEGLRILRAGGKEDSSSFRYFRWRMLATYALDVERMPLQKFFGRECTLEDLEMRMKQALLAGRFHPGRGKEQSQILPSP